MVQQWLDRQAVNVYWQFVFG